MSGIELFVQEFDLRTLVQVRHDIENCCAKAGLDDRSLYWFVVAVNEITTNAVRHGGGRGRVRLWRVDDRLHCEIVDWGPGIPPDQQGRVRPSPYTLGGRGLWLARQGCETVTLDSGSDGATVTLTQPLPRVGCYAGG